MDIRYKIVESALNQFLIYGVRNVSMNSIATDIGISKRTIYEIFKDKTELVHNCMEKLKYDHEERSRKISSSSNNVIETFFTFMKEGIKTMSSINPVFFRDVRKFYLVSWNTIVAEIEKDHLYMTEKLLEKGIKEGLFRDDIDIKILSKLFYEQINLIADEKIFPRDEFNHADIFQSLIINFVRGISTTKGIKIIESNL